MFGAVNSLFSGLAFAGIIYTIAVQRQELQEQRKAIKMQTEELALQREAIEMQNEELRMQHEETARSTDQLDSQRRLMNQQVVMTTVNELIKIKNKRIDHLGITIKGEEVKGIKALSALVKRNRGINKPITNDEAALQNYFNSFFYTLQYINDSDLDLDQKKVLSNLLDLETGDSEIYILFEAFGNDNQKFNLLNQYGFYDRYNNIRTRLQANVEITS